MNDIRRSLMLSIEMCYHLPGFHTKRYYNVLFGNARPGIPQCFLNKKDIKKRDKRVWIVMILFLLTISACSEKSTVGPDDNDDDLLLTCTELSFTTAAGITLDEISIGKIPGNFEDPIYATVIAGDTDPAHTFVFVDESLNAQIVVPLHPITPLSGGEVSIVVTDGTRTCDPVMFNIQPLPETPGEFSSVVDGLQEILRQQLEVFGTTPEEIIATPVNDLPVLLHPAALIQSVIDHPENERSLRVLASGEGEIGNDESLELAERLLARIKLSETLMQAANKAKDNTNNSLLSDEIEQCFPENIGNDAFKLDSCMKQAADAKLRAEGASGEVLNDLNMMFGIASLAPNPFVEILSNVLGTIAWAIQNERERTAAMLPSYLSELTLVFSQVEFTEDDESNGEWSADLVAGSERWDLGQELIELGLQAANLFRAIEKLGKADAINDLIVYIGSGPVAQALIGDGTLEEFVVEPQEFGPVDITSDNWSVVDIVTGTSIDLFSHNNYRPVEPGISRISIKTPDGFFGGNQIVDFQDIEVTEIIVRISPDETRVQAGEIAFFTASIENAKYPELVQIDESVTLQGEPEIFYEGGGAYTVALQAPEEPDYSNPDLLTIEHTAGSGALANRPNPKAIATVRFASIEILSNTTCAQPGQEVQFSTEVLGMENEDVFWSASLGDDPEDGLYIVPQAATGTEVTIRAESVVDADLFDETTFTIGCVCSFTLQVGDNPTYTGQPGDVANYQSIEGAVPGEPNAINSISFSDVEGFSAVFGVEIPTTVINGPGEYPIDTASGGLGYGGAGDFYDSTNEDSGTIRIFEYEPHTKLIGELSGTTREYENSNSPPIFYSASFRIFPPPESTGWNYNCEVTVLNND
jgi:hypothetical protein